MVDMQELIQKPAGQLFDDLLEIIRAFSISHGFEDDVCLVGLEFARKPERKKS
jgi:serine phosphatase RsbU (regulator of sigma subunit)